MTTYPSDWKEFISLLNAHRVRFLIVGAHALAANGRPRATQDLDVFIDGTSANVRRIAAALAEFGFTDLAREAGRFEQPERMATLGAPPLRIDIMNYIDGVSFREAWRGRMSGQLADLPVSFLGLAELKKNKLASGRAKDLADIALIEEMERAISAKKQEPRRSPQSTRKRAERPAKRLAKRRT